MILEIERGNTRSQSVRTGLGRGYESTWRRTKSSAVT